MANETNKQSRPLSFRELLTGEFLTYFVFYAIPIGVAAATVIFMFYHLDVQMVEHNIRNTEHHHLEMRDIMIQENFGSVMAGLRLLATMHDPHGILPYDAVNFKNNLIKSFLVFCSRYSHFQEIRSVSVTGRETSRVVCGSGRPLVVPDRELRNHDKSTLGKFLPNLERDDVFISGIEAIPVKSGTEIRAKPVIRFAMPLSSRTPGAGTILLIDVDLRHLISDIILDTGQGGSMILVERNGRFLRKPGKNEKWGDTLIPGRQLMFKDVYPQVWEKIWGARYGVLETPAGLFTFSTLALKEVLKDKRLGRGEKSGAPVQAPLWKIVSYVPSPEITAGRDKFAKKFILLIPAPFLVTLYLAHVAVRRRRAVRDLEENEEYLRRIMDSVVDGIVTTDQQGRIERVNAAIPLLFGFDSQEDQPEEISQLVPLETLDEQSSLAQLWGGRQDTRHPARAEMELKRKDGSEFPVELVLMEAELGGGRRFIWIFRDISERQAFEARQNANRMRFFHQTKMAEIGLIAAGIIHEVGNPIAALTGMVTQMSEDVEEGNPIPAENLREKLNMAAYQTQRLAGITREISDFVRTRPGETELFDLNSLIRSTVRLVRYDARWKYILLNLDLDPEIPAILGIQDQLSQVLMNLLVNAGDAVEDNEQENRKVSVKTELRHSHILLSISDNGHGMSEHAKKHAFDSFFTTKPEGKGTGLGLSLCQSIIAAHQGEIEYESAEGEGAVFLITLPVPQQLESLRG